MRSSVLLRYGDRTPACRKGLLQNVWCIDLIYVLARQNIDRTAQCAIGVKGVNGVPWCRVNANCDGLFRDSGRSLTSNRSDCCDHEEGEHVVDPAGQKLVADHGWES